MTQPDTFGRQRAESRNKVPLMGKAPSSQSGPSGQSDLCSRARSAPWRRCSWNPLPVQ